jgi:beta-lactamase class D
MGVRRIRSALASALLSGGLGIAHADNVCTLIVDAGSGQSLRQEGSCDRRVTPASTFKIAIALMGFDAKVLKDEHTPALPFRKGYPDWLPVWKMTTDPASWIKNSVVWYSQQVMQMLGEPRVKRYLQAFRYGNEDLSGDAGENNGLKRAWLSSSLQISPNEQIAFLREVVNRRLPVSAHAYDMTAHVTALKTLSNDWELHGKTGTGAPVNADGSRDWQHSYGWFVGWAQKDQRRVVFARLIQDQKPEETRAGVRARDELLSELPATLKTLE